MAKGLLGLPLLLFVLFINLLTIFMKIVKKKKKNHQVNAQIFVRAQAIIFKLLLMSKLQSKTQRLFIYQKWQKNGKSLHLRS